MVGDALVVVELEVPDEAAVPVELLDSPPLTGAAEEPLAVVERGGAEEMAVLEEIGLLASGVLAFPRANDSPLHVDQVALLRVQRRDQGIALEGLRVVELEAELGAGGLLRRRLALLRRWTSSGAAGTAMATVASVRAVVAKTTMRRQIRSGRNFMEVTLPENASKGF